MNLLPRSDAAPSGRSPALRPHPKPLQPWRVITLVGLLAATYAGLHLLWFSATPLGRVPVLDEREMLALAHQLADGVLPREPFYRGMLYPEVLAGLQLLGVDAQSLFGSALVLGAIFHATSAMLVAALSNRLFGDLRCGLLAGVLYSLYPVSVHLYISALDTGLATTLVLGGAYTFFTAGRSTFRLTLSSSLFSLAALARPQWIAVWLALPVFACILRLPARQTFQAWATGGMLLLCSGLVQKSVSGEFRIMPWQGAYNLWAANRPDFNGRYYAQSVSFAAAEVHLNPAQTESILLYRAATGRNDAGVDEMNRYWIRRLASALSTDPAAWAALVARKAYYLLNDFEQYNNKTYLWHKERAPLLRLNPLGWGLLLTMATAGAAVLYYRDSRLALTIGAVVATLAAAILTAFVSDRFRLPLAALLCVLGGGITTFAALPARMRLFTAVGCALVASVTFSDYFNVRGTETYLQDEILSAQAALEAGDDRAAWQNALAAFARSPDNQETTELVVLSGFNLALDNGPKASELQAWADASRAFVVSNKSQTPRSMSLAALAIWLAGDRAAALAIWRRLGTEPNAVGARILAKDWPKEDRQWLLDRSPPEIAPLLHLARITEHPHPNSDEARSLAIKWFPR